MQWWMAEGRRDRHLKESIFRDVSGTDSARV